MQPATRESNSERRVGLSPGGCMQKWDVRKTLVTCAGINLYLTNTSKLL